MNKFNSFGYNAHAYNSEFIDNIYATLKFWLFFDIQHTTNRFAEELIGWQKAFSDNEYILGNIEKIRERIIRDRDLNKYINKQAGVRFWSKRK